ncbi:hypothetical protein [Nostoc sp.]|uniref:hypothetical protein n=1 Tax=Nostoc sp. TaxID=1180 RepID=UPI002FF4FB0F
MTSEQRLITFDVATAENASSQIGAKLNYRSQGADTSIDADTYLFSQLRKLSLEQRIKMFAAHERGIKKLCLAIIFAKLH